jgi:hypothetical protein
MHMGNLAGGSTCLFVGVTELPGLGLLVLPILLIVISATRLSTLR